MLNKLTGLRFIGKGLVRPECVLAHSSESLLVPDWTDNGGFALVAPDGGVERVLARNVAEPIRPNGIALEPGGTVLLAHLGAETGGVFRMDGEGNVEPVLLEVDGRVLPPTNFPCLDREGRLWITVSTRMTPRAAAYRGDVADGFVVLLDRQGARIVAEGVGYTNECAISPDGETLYVNETFGRRLSAFSIRSNGSLTDRHVVTEFGAGTFPDGLTMDEEGGLWITSIVSNRVIRWKDGTSETMLEDVDAEHLAQVETAFANGTMGRPHLDNARSEKLKNISSLAFGGPDRRTIYLGCLLGDAIAVLPSPVTGAEPVHWNAAMPRG